MQQIGLLENLMSSFFFFFLKEKHCSDVECAYSMLEWTWKISS